MIFAPVAEGRAVCLLVVKHVHGAGACHRGPPVDALTPALVEQNDDYRSGKYTCEKHCLFRPSRINT